MPEEEQIMGKQAWSRQAIGRAVALSLVMPFTTQAQAYPLGHHIGGAYQMTAGAEQGPALDEAHPKDDGSIIVECLGFTRIVPSGRDADATSTLQTVSMPQHPLGPSTCGPGEKQGAGGGGSGGLMTVF
jgi:hypothetical protein